MKRTMNIKSLTLVEVLVVLAIISILASLLIPSLRKSRQKAKELLCTNHLRQIGLALHQYTSDNDLRFPNGDFGSREWLGKKGTGWSYRKKVTERPLNKYLGYNKDGLTHVPVTVCPVIVPAKNNQTSEQRGTYYFGNMNKFNDPNGLYNKKAGKSYKTAQIYKGSLMVSLAGKGAHNYTRDANVGVDWKNSHESNLAKFSFLYVDGHVRLIKAGLGEGSSGIKTRLNWTNEP